MALDPRYQAETADLLTVRRSNLSLVLRHLRSRGPRSRARIADETGLNKATVSSLVAELTECGLVQEGEVERAGHVGRPGQAVEVDGRVCGLGVEINVDYLAVHVLDLRNDHVISTRSPLDVPSLGPGPTLDRAAELIVNVTTEVARTGRDVAGITVALPGLVETAEGILRHAPNLGWQDVPVAAELGARLPTIAGLTSETVRVDNDANLGALAEHVMGSHAGTADLLYLTGETGVGGGVIADGRLLRGAAGFGGEVGHMAIAEPLHLCGCGRRGCWETQVGLAALLRAVADPGDEIANPTVDLEERLAEIRRRAELGDGRTVRGLHAVGKSLGLGASILINIVNPRVLILGGYFAALGDFVLDAMFAELDQRVVAPNRGNCSVELSTLGFTAAGRGGAHVALEAVLNDPTSVGRTTSRQAS